MAEVRVFHDPKGQTLTVWFADPAQEYVCEETGEEVVLMKDRVSFGVRSGTWRRRRRKLRSLVEFA